MLHRFCIGPTPLRRGSPLAPVHLTRPQAFTERQTRVPDCIRGQKSACTPHRHRVRTRRSFSPSMLAARAMSLRLPYTTCVRYLHCENDVLRPGHQLPSSRSSLTVLLCKSFVGECHPGNVQSKIVFQPGCYETVLLTSERYGIESPVPR